MLGDDEIENLQHIMTAGPMRTVIPPEVLAKLVDKRFVQATTGGHVVTTQGQFAIHQAKKEKK